MPNKNYRKGYMKERKIVNTARAKGHVSFRSAGSHSPIDVIIIDDKKQLIWLVQAKPDSMSAAAKKRLTKQWEHLNKLYVAEFIVV